MSFAQKKPKNWKLFTKPGKTMYPSTAA